MPDWTGGAAPRNLVGDVDPDAAAPGVEETVSEASSGDAAAQDAVGIEGEPDGE
ncbi:hypothetical protein [Streptomyces sp. MUSC 14]|uniref:hypothetical protein n=1 Tax=Streptomyces sp. MUSC 14 TaxID=1354889 RepID=UPI0015A638D9|nr:hypothetical protein [Streptomyces sp. MUSC 14]